MISSMRAALKAIDTEPPNVVVYGDDSVYDESGGNCVHAQR
jgi:hypothetical protein